MVIRELFKYWVTAKMERSITQKQVNSILRKFTSLWNTWKAVNYSTCNVTSTKWAKLTALKFARQFLENSY